MKSSNAIAYQDGLDILVCKIIIWEPSDKQVIDISDPDENKCLVLRECQSIEIEESYKKLIGTASVRFPRGTVIKRTVTANGIEEDGVTSIYTERLNDGAIIEKRPGYSVAQPKDFKVGQRIRIYLGYYRDKGKIFANEKARQQEMEKEALGHAPNFDGYIVKCGVSTPIEIKCESVASNLKRKTCPNILINNATISDLLKAGDRKSVV
mgnify:FL=1